jgi:hypothetical protein
MFIFIHFIDPQVDHKIFLHAALRDFSSVCIHNADLLSLPFPTGLNLLRTKRARETFPKEIEVFRSCVELIGGKAGRDEGKVGENCAE